MTLQQKNKLWTQDDINFLKENYIKMTNTQLAKALKRSKYAITSRLTELRLLRPTLSDKERFWLYVDKNGPTPSYCPELGPCWVWTGKRTKFGYGHFWLKGKTIGAHRASLMFDNRDPARRCALHKCHNPSCVNPSHLYVGSLKENTLDMYSAGRAVDNTGEKNGNAVLTKQEVIRIRELRETKELTQVEIGEIFGVDQSTISKIIHNKNWNQSQGQSESGTDD